MEANVDLAGLTPEQRVAAMEFLFDNQQLPPGLLAMILDMGVVGVDDEPEGRPEYKSFRFDISTMNQAECLSRFRFNAEDIARMVDVYEIPDPFITSNNIPIPATEALCIMLRRLAVSSRLLEMNDVFGRPPEALSRVFNEMVIWFTTRWGGLLTWDPVLLAPEKLEEYCNAVTSRSGRMGVVWGFIDGTVRQICRPSQWQDIMYNGHKRWHGMKYQCVMLPNGLIGHVFGGYDGRRHDSIMYLVSGLSELLEQHSRTVDSDDDDPSYLALYGDPAYGNSAILLSPYKGGNLTPEQAAFNKDMSSVRECVEWGFGEMVSMFGFLDHTQKSKLLQSPITLYYIAGILLRNTRACIYGNNTSKFFNLSSPSLEQYFHAGIVPKPWTCEPTKDA